MKRQKEDKYQIVDIWSTLWEQIVHQDVENFGKLRREIGISAISILSMAHDAINQIENLVAGFGIALVLRQSKRRCWYIGEKLTEKMKQNLTSWENFTISETNSFDPSG